MASKDVITIEIESSPGEFASYVIAEGQVPATDRLPWGLEECDAFVVVLNAQLLSDALAANIATNLVRLPVDWVEIIGARSEYLHDLVDSASVSAGRQGAVGDGTPMTAWQDQLSDIGDAAAYVRTGGQGGTGRKVVVVIGPEQSATSFVGLLADFRLP